MKYLLPLTLFLLLKCTTDEGIVTSEVSLNIIDTITIQTNTQTLQFAEKSKVSNRLLFYDAGGFGYPSGAQSIVETDLKGDILRTIKLFRPDTDNIGQIISSIGYLPDGRISILTDRGLFAENGDGVFQTVFPHRNPTPLFLNREHGVLTSGGDTIVVAIRLVAALIVNEL